MADPIPPPTKRKIKIAYMTGGLSLSAAAAKYGVSERMAHEWSRKEGWAKQKLERNGQAPSSPQPQLVSFPTARGGQQQPQQVEAALELPESLADLLKILDEVIARMAAAVRCPSDGRNRANAGATLARLVEQRAKLGSDEWLLDAVMARYPTPASLVKALRDLHYGDETPMRSQIN